MEQLRGLDAWIEGRHITDDPRSPYYDGPECICDGDATDADCPACNPEDFGPDEDAEYDRWIDERAERAYDDR